MKTKTLSMKSIRMPDVYIRTKGSDDKHVEALREAVLAATENGKPSEVTPELFARVLGPIIVRKTAPKRGREWETVEGVHRYMVAHSLKLDEVPCDIREYESEGEAHLDQLVENLKAKKGIDLKDRDAWIRMLVKDEGVKQETVARLTGMSKGSISRIVGGTQSGEGRKEAEAKPKKRKKSKKSKKNGNAESNGFDVADWYASLESVTSEYKENRDAIVAGKQGASEVVADAFNALHDLVNA